MTKILTMQANMGGVPPEPERVWRDELTPHIPIGAFPLDARPVDCNQICRTMTQAERDKLLASFLELNELEVAERMLDDIEMVIGTEHIETGAVRWNIECQCDLPPGTRIYTRNYG